MMYPQAAHTPDAAPVRKATLVLEPGEPTPAGAAVTAPACGPDVRSRGALGATVRRGPSQEGASSWSVRVPEELRRHE